MNPLIGLIIVIVIISAVVGAIAQFLNKLGEMNAQNRRPVGAGPRAEPPGGATRQADRDMDRFLAEIDRLRRKNADAGQQQSGSATPVVPVARPVSKPADRDRPRPRVVAELAETQPQRHGPDAQGFTAPPSAPPSPIVPTSASGAAYSTQPTAQTQIESLPVAQVVTPTSSTGAPATRVTRLAQRARPAPKTNLARNLTDLLNSGQGVALAVILSEVLGPPKCKKHG